MRYTVEMAKTYSVAVVGATGAVGQALLSILAERNFPVSTLHALASARSAGQKVEFGEQLITVEDLETFDFTGVDIGLFAAGSEVSAVHAPRAAAARCVVIDKTAHFRMDPDVPLIVPEVNPAALAGYTARNIIANPNCSTIQMVLALKPIHDVNPIKRIIVSTYQAVSGTGVNAIDELTLQSEQVLGDGTVTPYVYDQQIAFNVLPHIDDFTDNGYTKEELKMHDETRKIFDDEAISVSATAVRVPVVYGHSEAVLIETERPILPDAARKLLAAAPGIAVVDDPAQLIYPTAVNHAAGQDAVSVGRIRSDLSNPHGLWLWIVADNVRKGAALNGVQIAELLIKDYLK